MLTEDAPFVRALSLPKTRLLTSSPDARPAHSDAILSPDEVFGKDSCRPKEKVPD